MDYLDFDAGKHKWVLRRLILLSKVGSHAYGTNVEGSDVDYRGVCIPPLRNLFGLQEFDKVVRSSPDLVVMGLRTFLQQAIKGITAPHELLWTDPADHIHTGPFGAILIKERAKLLSKRVTVGLMGHAESEIRGMNKSPDLSTTSDKKIERHALYGYDTKQAMHALRLLRMCLELVKTGELHVKRHDAENLKAILAGSMTQDQVLMEVSDLIAQIQEAEGFTKLPEEPDLEGVENLCVALTQGSFNFEVGVPVYTGLFQATTMSFEAGSLSEKVLSAGEKA